MVIVCIEIHAARRIRIGHARAERMIFRRDGKLRLLECILAGGKRDARARRHPLAGGQLRGDGLLPGDGDGSVDAVVRLHNMERILACDKREHAVAVLVREGLSVGIFRRDGDAGPVGGRITLRAVREGDTEALAALCLLIRRDRARERVRKRLKLRLVRGCKVCARCIIGALCRLLDILRLFQIVRHDADQRKPCRRHKLLAFIEAEIPHRGRTRVQIIAAVFVTAVKISVHAVDLFDPALLQTLEGMSACQQHLPDGRLRVCIVQLLRRHDDAAFL